MEGQPRKRPERRRKHPILIILGVIGKIFFGLFTLLLIGLLTGSMIVYLFMTYVNTTLTPTLQVNADDYTMNLTSIIYYQDKETQEWVELQKLYGTENRIWVDFEEMPDAMWQSVVAIEDERFFTHNGVDWWRTAGATVNMFISMKDTFGGSTITQQLLKNMTGDDDGTVNRKVREIFRALEFEKNYTKNDILELYLNTVYFGNGCYGVQTAAQFYFGKDIGELSAAECASIISITNNPSVYSPIRTLADSSGHVTGYEINETNVVNNKSRQELVLKNMWNPETGLCYLTDAEYDAALAEQLPFLEEVRSVEELVAEAMAEEAEATGEEAVETVGDTSSDSLYNSYFVDEVFRSVVRDLAETKSISSSAAETLLYNGGYHIYTTLDPDIQAIAESVYEDRSNLDVTSVSGQQLQSGITIIDNDTGKVVAMVGGVGEKTGNLTWNYATGSRQVGSSIKPLTVYAPALESGAITMASNFDDYPVRLLEDSAWPKNSPSTYRGRTMLSTAVANSINTVAVQTVELNGLENAYTFATENLGLSLVPSDLAVSPLALGGLTYGLSTLEMAAGYATFPNEGIYNEPRFYELVCDNNGEVVIDNVQESTVAMKETTAYFMNTLLQGVVSSGTGTSADFVGQNIAGKTGTTSENYDRYFVGYTPYYTAAVWTGYDQNEKITYSGNPAITMWKKVMEEVHQGLERGTYSKPETGLTTVTVCQDSGLLCSDACALDLRGNRAITVTVAAGTAPTETCDLHVIQTYCINGNTLVDALIPKVYYMIDADGNQMYTDFGVAMAPVISTTETELVGQNCPDDCVATAAFLDITREVYDPVVVTSDNDYLLSTWMAKGDCLVHTDALPEETPEDDQGDVTVTDDPNAGFYTPEELEDLADQAGSDSSTTVDPNDGFYTPDQLDALDDAAIPEEPEEPEEPEDLALWDDIFSDD